MVKAIDILKEYWGYDSFRGQQEDIIDSVLSGKDTLAIMPTGGGKSITFQVPALMRPGTTIVISPLIALMTDQVQNLRKRGVRAVVLHSGLSHSRIFDTLEQAQFGAYDLIYVSPERLQSELFRTRIAYIDVNLIAVDEAHCISEWGYDFRPSYLKIPELRQLMPEVPVLALTASATKQVEEDICRHLSISEEARFKVFRQSVKRDNLVYVVRQTEDRVAEAAHILNSVPGTAIIYTRTREKTELVSRSLRDDFGIAADFYHAGLDSAERTKRQEAWMKGKTRVLCATNAFGMGIDKSDVRMVIHYDVPDSLEAYYQEAGRAGRDGKKSYAVILTDNALTERILHRHENVFPPKEYVKKVYQKLAEYFVVGADSGLGAVFAFELEKFCQTMKLQYGAVSAALQVLEWAGYITLTEARSDASKVKILISPKDIWQWKMSNIDDDLVMEYIMRMHTGVFTDAVHINEEDIAIYTHTTADAIYRHLKKLSKKGDIQYIPFKRTPLLIYNTARMDVSKLTIPAEAYDSRIEKMAGRLRKVYEYVVSDRCRTELLEEYFGDEDIKPCGICDNCLKIEKR